MNQLSSSIEVVRDGNKLTKVRSLMPVWAKTEAPGILRVSIPLLGLETLANTEDEISDRVNEAFKAFCHFSEVLGLGLEAELTALNWHESAEHAFNLNVPSPFESVLETGEPSILEAEFC